VTVSRDSSKAVYQGIKSAGIRFLTALPETWLVYRLQLAEDDPEMTLVEVAKEEEAIGIAAGAYFAGARNALLMQNHGFLASVNGIVSLAMLYDLGHRETFFYLQHAMGLASSIGLGLALNRPDAGVVVLDEDGSVLMNLGGLATLGRYRPPNLTHVVFDNGSLLSTGGFVSHTASGRTDLAAVARAAGCPRVLEAPTVFRFMEAVGEAFTAGEMTTIVARVEPVGPDRFHMDLGLPENAFRFRRAASARR
jgi:sulfopyruvate decarboxylase subunit beta